MAEELIVDLSNYKDRVGSRVAPDRYRVQVEDVEAAKSQAGNPMVNVWFRIVGGEFDGQTIVDRLTMTEKALFRVVGFMQAIGLPTPKKRLKINIRQFVGKVLDIDVADGEPYNGRIKSEVRAYLRVAGASTGGSGDDLEDLEEADLPEAAEAVTDDSVTDLPEAPIGNLSAASAEPKENRQGNPFDGYTDEEKPETAMPKVEKLEVPAGGLDLDDIEL